MSEKVKHNLMMAKWRQMKVMILPLAIKIFCIKKKFTNMRQKNSMYNSGIENNFHCFIVFSLKLNLNAHTVKCFLKSCMVVRNRARSLLECISTRT